MTPPARRRRLRSAVAVAVLLAGIVACGADPGVTSEEANALDASSTTTPVGSTDPSTPGPAETTAAADTGPDFTLPDLTLPDHDADRDRRPGPGPATTIPPTTTPTATPTDDRAAAGDPLFPELGNDGLDVTHYLVRIGYRPVKPVIDGEVTVSATALRALDQIVLDAVGLDVAEVTVDGRSSGFTVTDDELVIDGPLAAGEAVEVAVRYSAAPTGEAAGFDLEAGWFATPDGSYVLNQPDGARLWMPADDHPGDKATWRFELTVPDGLAGIANGEQQPSVDAGPDTTWIWEQREPMATYLVQLLTGDYEVIEGGTAGGVPLVHVALAGDVDRMRPYFDTVIPQLEYFETVFGPYPLDRYGLAFTESFSGLAMETQGRSMFSADDFLGTDGSIGYFEDLVLAHELAHQWFGDAVTPADWADLWLNESFATYGQWLWFDHSGRAPLDESAELALATRQAPSEPTGAPSVDNLFGLERYDGGAVVLHALRGEIGDDAFFATLARWAADNDGTSRSTEDFIALAEQVADRPLTAFFATWLFSDAVPDAYPT